MRSAGTSGPSCGPDADNYERWASWDAIEAWRAVARAPDTGIEMRHIDVTIYEMARSRPPF